MDKLYNKCRDMVKHNVCSKDNEVIDVLTLSVLSLYMSMKPELLTRLPELLRTLHVYSDNRSVVEVCHEELDNYQLDGELGSAASAIVRDIYYKGDKCFEFKSLIIPKSNINQQPIQVIENTTHELVHLLRFGQMTINGEYLESTNGISQRRISTKDSTSFSKNKMLEECIVQEYAKNATKTLLDGIDEVRSFSPIVRRVKRTKNGYESGIYETLVKMFEPVFDDAQFRQLVELSFTERNPRLLSRYFNDVCDDNYSFTKYSDSFDLLFQCLMNRDYGGIKKFTDQIFEANRVFKRNVKTYEKVNLG